MPKQFLSKNKVPESIYDASGKRLYMNQAEVAKFLKAADEYCVLPKHRTLCYALAETGARISEILALKFGDFDPEEKTIRIRTLKQHNSITKEVYERYRVVPISPKLADMLLMAHGRPSSRNFAVHLWPGRTPGSGKPLSRAGATEITNAIFNAAGIADGPHKCAKGLRHGFGVRNILAGVPVCQVQKWMGHSSPHTTAIYLQVAGEEERTLAQQSWEKLYDKTNGL